MSETDALVKLETRDRVAYLTLDSPPLNILTAAMMAGISDALETAAADRDLVAVAVTANGKAFSAGADVGEHRPENAPDMIAAFDRLFDRFEDLEVPVVMAVDGAALGGGFELVLAADVLLATERATFGQPEIRLAFFAPLGVAYLPHLVGPKAAMEITCSGRSFDAATLHRWGLVSRVVPPDDLEAALEAELKDLRRASPLVMRLNVRQVRRQLGPALSEARKEAQRVFLDELMATEDVREGIAAFFEKRRPAWKNR